MEKERIAVQSFKSLSQPLNGSSIDVTYFELSNCRLIYGLSGVAELRMIAQGIIDRPRNIT
ncbi:hypothetical protein DSCOOX_10310 [Desulfosarcina ovata subsp. ovata]|uniref:Uncharacterized protein n=1 Tax=Desulfosarcina ovata subsp. ovata TaxID=2752305 RepID=A0A5K8A5W3_9BACT|nr:hypothetical protein DSCOOX_10310 [Desulfosarcina ovata subsp. ovata]